MAKGLDVGTSFIVCASPTLGDQDNSHINYVDFRDAFYVLRPSSAVSKAVLEKGLEDKHYLIDGETFILIGQDAIDKALEKNENANRPMNKGVISSKEKDSRKILSFILKKVVGDPNGLREKIVFSVPAQPIDQDSDIFDIGYHEDFIRNTLNEVGYDAKSINEAEALCYSELAENYYTGIGMSCGAGMVNICIMINGEPILVFSTTKSGDWIDKMSSVAVGENEAFMQSYKENKSFIIGSRNTDPISDAIAVYYERMIDYTVKQMIYGIESNRVLSQYKKSLPIVIGGGTAKASGFVDTMISKLKLNEFPINVSEVKLCKNPMQAVARGCLIASRIMD